MRSWLRAVSRVRLSVVFSVTFFIFTLSIIPLSLLTACAGFENKADNQEHKRVSDVNATKMNADGNSGFSGEGGVRKRLLVLPFLDSNAQDSDELRLKARDEFINEMNKTGELIVVDSKDLGMDPARFVKNNEYQMDEVSKKAHDLGVAAIMEGKILDIKVKQKADEVGLFRQLKTGYECIARVRIMSTRNRKELFNLTKTVSIDESTTRVAKDVDTDRFLKSNPEVLEHLVEDTFLEYKPQIIAALASLSWEGRVALVSGDRIYLNVGKISGVRVGDLLRVSDEGEEIYDPQSGQFIGKGPGHLKGTLEVVSFFGKDGAVCVIHSGAGFKENDRVELY